jgi:hypothetical protein
LTGAAATLKVMLPPGIVDAADADAVSEKSGLVRSHW